MTKRDGYNGADWHTGLSVHMNQVHKEQLLLVENSLPNRAGLDVEIFGMEGIPEDVVQAHNQSLCHHPLSHFCDTLLILKQRRNHFWFLSSRSRTPRCYG